MLFTVLKSFGFGIALGAVLVLLLAAVLGASALGFQSSCPSSHRARAVVKLGTLVAAYLIHNLRQVYALI